MRELRVLDLDEGLERTFPEINELSAGCRFRNCSHSNEAGCAVLAAVAAGRLPEDRLASYRKLEAEAAYERRRGDRRAAAEHVAEHKTALRTLKYHVKFGSDLMEVAPPNDPAGNTSLSAANLLFEMLCVLPGVSYRH